MIYIIALTQSYAQLIAIKEAFVSLEKLVILSMHSFILQFEFKIRCLNTGVFAVKTDQLSHQL